MKTFEQAIEASQLTYNSDISWEFSYNNRNISVHFYKNECGNNIIEEMAIMKKGIWVAIVPTDNQLELMYTKLNNTQYRGVESEDFEQVNDMYDYYGVKRENFY